MKLFAGVDEQIRAIAQDFQIGIAGQYGRELLDLLETHGILDCFTWRFTQDDFKITKPDPRYLLQIAAACGVDPETCIMVGDRIDKDVIPAKQIGMKTIRIRTGLHIRQEPRTPYEIPMRKFPISLILRIQSDKSQNNLRACLKSMPDNPLAFDFFEFSYEFLSLSFAFAECAGVGRVRGRFLHFSNTLLGRLKNYGKNALLYLLPDICFFIPLLSHSLNARKRPG